MQAEQGKGRATDPGMRLNTEDNSMIRCSAVEVSTPESSTQIGAGARLWASGSQYAGADVATKPDRDRQERWKGGRTGDSGTFEAVAISWFQVTA